MFIHAAAVVMGEPVIEDVEIPVIMAVGQLAPADHHLARCRGIVSGPGEEGKGGGQACNRRRGMREGAVCVFTCCATYRRSGDSRRGTCLALSVVTLLMML